MCRLLSSERVSWFQAKLIGWMDKRLCVSVCVSVCACASVRACGFVAVCICVFGMDVKH